MLSARVGTPDQANLAHLVGQAVAGSLALCEPFFGQASIALSRGISPFKVHVLNDPGQGLVKLFEMVRVDKQGLREAIVLDDIGARFPAFSGRSSFLNTASDANTGIAAFKSCVENLGIETSVAVGSMISFNEIISAIHERLVPVLVENLPAPDFITRFDRQYTVFFIPRVQGKIDPAVKIVMPALAGLRGHIVIEAGSRGEVEDVLARHGNGVRFKVNHVIPVAGRGSNARCLVVVNRA